MNLNPKNTNKSIVFNARDFLSEEFPKIGVKLDEYERIYLVTSNSEMKSISAHDPEGIIYNLSNMKNYNNHKSTDKLIAQGDLSYLHNNDRHLRSYSTKKIHDITRSIENLCFILTSNHNPVIYVDEPVSGYPNHLLNKYLTSKGIKCLHFQTSWLPGYMYFSNVPAQDQLEKLGYQSNGHKLMLEHIKKRSLDKAKPLYVINYSKKSKRFFDSIKTFSKGLNRILFRTNDYYINSDAKAHFFHATALISTFKGGYLNKKSIGSLKGKYIFYPLHYEPEAVLNFMSKYTRQEEIVEQIIDTLPLSYELLLKEHPSQPGSLNTSKWKGIINNKRVKKIRGDINARIFFNLDITILSIGSTLSIEAAFMGKPVGLLGETHFASMPGITKLESVNEWIDLLSDYHPARHTDMISWYANFVNDYCFEGYFLKNKSRTKEVSSIIKKITSQLYTAEKQGNKI